MRCVARFWAWQLWRRTTGRPIQAEFLQGWKLELPPWSELAGITAATGLHEPSEELFALAYLRPGDIVLDVGANIGIYTVACAWLGARVAAFEPSTLSRQALQRNVALNGIEERVRVFPIALGDAAGMVSLTTSLDVGNHLVAPDAASPTDERVPIQRLDSVISENSDWLARGNDVLLKIDVEGHDAAVLRGARKTLAERRPVVLVETWDGGVEVRNLLGDLGYRVYRYEFPDRRLVEYPASWSGQANFIAVSDEHLVGVEQRLAQATTSRPVPPRLRWLPAKAGQ